MKSHLVQILLPKQTGTGEPISGQWFDGLLCELTEKFGGVTSFIRAPGRGLWQNRGATAEDDIAVIEVMVTELDPTYWRTFRSRLERELSQEELVIRAQEITRL